MWIKIETNFAEVHKYIEKFGEKVVKSALKRSLRRVGTSVVAEAAKQIGSKKLLKIKARDLKKNRIRSYLKTTGDINDMVARIYFSGKGENLGRYFAKKKVIRVGKTPFGDKRTGVRVTIAGEGSFVAPGAFFMDRKYLKNANNSDYNPVMQRKGSARSPLRAAVGPSVSELVETSGILKHCEGYARERMAIELEANLKYYIDKEG